MDMCKQVAKESNSELPYGLVKDIMLDAIRVVLEEFLTNPAEADFSIQSIGRFYMNHRICHNNFPTENSPEYKTYWTIQFTPSDKLKEVLNGKRDPRTLVIGTAFLYPDFAKENSISRRGQKAFLTRDYKVKYKIIPIDNYDKAFNEVRKSLELLKREENKNDKPIQS